ncbi:hypothetical protein [Serinibacter arcticus]|uniref:hypothetical protein n=1 Tax=Serinibacter arcticus TaxID=1655435 RepID=UPI001091BF3B|nr:hypothetical protein [Serinibacter arcticus]
MTSPTWSLRAAAELQRGIELDRVHGVPSWVTVERITTTSDTSLEVVYRVRGETNSRGLRMDELSAEHGPDLFRDRTPEEVGFYLAHTGVLEPSDLSSFLPVDADGIAWMTPAMWMKDVAWEDRP